MPSIYNFFTFSNRTRQVEKSNHKASFNIFRITWILFLIGTVCDHSYLENIRVLFFNLNLQTASTGLLVYVVTFLILFRCFAKSAINKQDRFTIVLLILLLIEAFISSYFSKYRAAAVSTTIFKYGLFFIAFLTTLAYCNHFKNARNFIIKSFIYVNVLVIVTSIVDFYVPAFNRFLIDYFGHMESRHSGFEISGSTYIRPSGFITDTNLTALSIVVSSLLLLISPAAPAPRAGKNWFEILFYLAGGYSFGMLASRSALLSVLAAVIFLYVFKKQIRKKIIYFCLLFFLVQLLTPQTQERIKQYFNKEYLKEEISIGRPVIWKAAIMAFQTNPVIGIGTDVFFKESLSYIDEVLKSEVHDEKKIKKLEEGQYKINPHNIFLSLLTEQGIIGLIIFTALIVYFVRRLVLERKHNSLAVAGVLLISSFLSNYAPYYKYYLIMCIIVYVISQQDSIIREIQS